MQPLQCDESPTFSDRRLTTDRALHLKNCLVPLLRVIFLLVPFFELQREKRDYEVTLTAPITA